MTLFATISIKIVPRLLSGMTWRSSAQNYT